MNRSTIYTIVALCVILALAAAATIFVLQKKSQQQLQSSQAGQALSNSEGEEAYSSFSGEVVDLEDFLGQPMVVTSWASWVPASATELPLLAGVAQDYAPEGVVVVGINRAENTATAQAYLASLGVAKDVQLIVDPKDKYYKAISGYTMPETLIYNQAGEVVLHKRGTITRTEIDTALASILEED